MTSWKDGSHILWLSYQYQRTTSPCLGVSVRLCEAEYNSVRRHRCALCPDPSSHLVARPLDKCASEKNHERVGYVDVMEQDAQNHQQVEYDTYIVSLQLMKSSSGQLISCTLVAPEPYQ